MNVVPDTRDSLILRLTDRRDVEAWDEFVAIYRPLVYRLARTKGLQDADALEVVQELFAAVSRAIDGWEPDPERGRFRDWLFRIARNLVLNRLTRPKHRPWAKGGDDELTAMLQYPDESDLTSTFDLEYRREVYRWSAAKVQTKVKPKTWEAFHLSYIEELPIASVAEQLSMTIGAVHIARSRVLGRLREVAKRFNKSAGERS